MKIEMSLPFSRVLPVVLTLLTFLAVRPVASAASVNAIKLVVSPNPAKVKQKITLTASVATKKKAATGGTVTFFDGKMPLSNVQVVGNKPAKGYKTGNAILTTILGPGTHSLTAVYAGTAQAPGRVTSKAVQVKVAGETGSMTVLTAKHNSKNSKNYDFTATVRGFGFAAPAGTVDIMDTTTNTDLGKTSLNAKTAAHGYAKALVSDGAGAPAQSVVADFNGDGLPDVAAVDAAFGPSTMVVFLGKGNGEFQKPPHR